MSTTSTQFAISLKGSAAIVTEYLEYAINSILYQRGVEPASQFAGVEKYGLTVLMSHNYDTVRYLRDTLYKAQRLLIRNELEDVTLFIRKKLTNEFIERWTFSVQNEFDDRVKIEHGYRPTSSKSMKRVQQEISQVMRQIMSTVSCLPLLDYPCTFEIWFGYKPGCQPLDLPIYDTSIRNAQSMHLKSFSTGLHKVETVVDYQEVDFIN